MPFVSGFEKQILEQKQLLLTLDKQLLATKQRVLDTWLRGISLGLKLKFKEEGQALFAEVRKQTDLDWLRRFLDRIDSADSLDDLRKLLP